MSKKQSELTGSNAEESSVATATVEAPPTRNRADVGALFHRLNGPQEAVRSGDRESLRDHLVLLHTPLVEHCARNFVASGEPIEDLVQEGYVGLIKAVDRFDPDKGVRFSTYACHLITGEIRHYLRDLGRLIHEPGWHFELRQRISRTNDQLTQKLGRAPEPEDIARTLGIEASSVRDVLRNQQVLTVENLDAETDREGDEGGSDWDHKLVASATNSKVAETQVEDQMMLGSALPQLRDLEKKAITLFFFEDCTKTEIAKRLDISVNHAAYLVKRGVEGLRQIIEESEITADLDTQSTPRLKREVQQRSRAAYLLELTSSSLQPKANGASTTRKGRPNRRSMKLVESAPALATAVSRSGIASFTEFALWVDEEVLRAARYAQEFSLLWLRVANWDAITEGMGDEEQRRALTVMQGLARRCCRATDKIATLSRAELPGLHLLVLMPHTSEPGRHTGERWMHACETFPQLLDDAAENAAKWSLETKFAFVLFPRDGKSADDLFRAMGEQLSS